MLFSVTSDVFSLVLKVMCNSSVLSFSTYTFKTLECIIVLILDQYMKIPILVYFVWSEKGWEFTLNVTNKYQRKYIRQACFVYIFFIEFYFILCCSGHQVFVKEQKAQNGSLQNTSMTSKRRLRQHFRWSENYKLKHNKYI